MLPELLQPLTDVSLFRYPIFRSRFDNAVPVCLLVYGFVREDARQLHPYELAAPRIPDSAVPVTLEKNKHDDYDYDAHERRLRQRALRAWTHGLAALCCAPRLARR